MSLNRKITAAVSAFILLSALCGCRSDVYYQNRAVEEARKFLLKEAGELDLYQQEYIRYTDPVILHSHILGETRYGLPDQLSNEQRQICVTWQLPGQEGVYMVYGVSSGRMANWRPERVLRRTYVKKNAPLAAAVAQANSYAVNNLTKDLSDAELNIIRFTPPALCMTDFHVGVKLPDEPEAREAAMAKNAKNIQLTLVWNIGSKKSVYFCGYGLPNMAQWNLERAGIIPEDELAPRIVRTVLSPEQFNEQLPEINAASPAKSAQK